MQSSFLPPTFTQYPFPGENSLLDGNGNVLTDSYRGISASAYDIHNLPISQTHTNGTISYWYDTNGNRVRKQQGGTDHYYVIGAGGETEAVYNWNGSLRFWNIVAGGQLIGKITPGGSLTRYYYVKDHLGSIRVTVKQDNTIAGWDDYYPFGMIMAGRSGNSGQADTKYKFSGKERDAETGQDWFQVRSYDSRIGSFRRPDPHKDRYPGLSPYNYVANNPLTFVDPTGMDSTVYFKSQSKDVTQEQVEAAADQGQNVLNQNKIPMKAKAISGYPDLSPTDVIVFLVEGPVLEAIKDNLRRVKGISISDDSEGVTAIGSQEGRVSTENLPSKGINDVGLGNLGIHEGFHAMGLSHQEHGRAGTMIYPVGSSNSPAQINNPSQSLSPQQVQSILETFLKRK